jgi:tRNA(fMet)-specific endonuclease VapC
MNYILDTNVISELVAVQPNPQVIQWIDSIPAEHFYLSVITIGELVKGIEKLPESARQQTLINWLHSELLVRFQDRLLALDVQTLIIWGQLVARLEAVGRPLPAIDSLLAATAAAAGFTLVTRNVNDFIDTGIAVLNPWDAHIKP